MAQSPYRSRRSSSMGGSGKLGGSAVPVPSAPARSKSTAASLLGERRQTPSVRRGKDDLAVPGKVKVVVRLRPRNADERVSDADFADCVELQPELKRLILRKNNWDCETFQFDEVFTETASQKRVYEMMAKPVVESILEGYNGTIMAYGQTGTGKTFTLGRLGEENITERGVMVRAVEDILADTSAEQETVSISYLQIYMDTLQDLLAPDRDDISIVEDPKSGAVTLSGATLVDVRDPKSFQELLCLGESNRSATNAKLNTDSSRTHAILVVNVKKVAKIRQDKEMSTLNENSKGQRGSNMQKSKLLIIDLAGSENIEKSGADRQLFEEAKYVNSSFTVLGKCINALAEDSVHIPFKDSKLTRLMQDSFGGTARASLILTVGPSPQHRGETANTIMFGQKGLKIENMVKLKEDFDYKSLCKRLEAELDRLVQENEHQAKAVIEAEEGIEKNLEESQLQVKEAEKKLTSSFEEVAAERQRLQNQYAETVRKLEEEHVLRKNVEAELLKSNQSSQIQNEKQIKSEILRHQQEIEIAKKKHQEELAELECQLNAERFHGDSLEKKLQDVLGKCANIEQKAEAAEQEAVMELKRRLKEERQLHQEVARDIKNFKTEALKGTDEEVERKVNNLEQQLEEELEKNKQLEEEIKSLKKKISLLKSQEEEMKKNFDRNSSGRMQMRFERPTSPQKPNHTTDTINGQRATISKLFEQVGLHKILSLLNSADIDVRIHAVKVVANLAAEEANQEKIVEAGGLDSLLDLLRDSGDETIRRVAAGAIANLAMNERNQERVMNSGGIKLLSKAANEAEDPQTLRMVAGAIANLCGNDKLQKILQEEGAIRALLGMARSQFPDVLAQVARGIANFAKCESRGVAQGQKKARSFLIEDGALPWIVANTNQEASPIRRHIELALCHLAQHEVNAKDLVVAGALLELVRISKECSREDIRNLAKRTLNGSHTFQTELRARDITIS